MNKLRQLAIVVTVALFLSLLAVSPLPISAASSSSSGNPCFNFTENNITIGTKECNSSANDLTIMFVPGQPCVFSIGSLNEPCPAGANNVDVRWGVLASGAPVITSCVWTLNSKVLKGVPCKVPKKPEANSFTFYGSVTQAFWTLNHKKLGKVIKAPTGTNDVEFTLVSVTA